MIVRHAAPADAAAMAELINEIIAIGGTTAHEDAFDVPTMIAYYIAPPTLVSCVVAEVDGRLMGFQGLFRSDDPADPLPHDWATIGTFARVGSTQRGVGAALFERTLAAARAAGIRTIDATIRADNTGGLAFYSRLGFTDYAQLKAMPLRDGTPVDRVRKRFDLSPA